MCCEENNNHGCCAGGAMHTPRFPESSCHCEGFGKHFIIPAVLLMIGKEPSHGYSLLKVLTEMGLVDEGTSPVMVYRVLNRLENDGLAAHEHVDEGQGPARKVFHLTEAGKEALASWNRRLGEHSEFIKWFEITYLEIEKG
ncbi:MAG: PadR family transcriptional regulator [Actinobacteria bacterium]|nr:PadR family transcriptional regulator [Actinomycetota bacterium]